MGDKTGLTPLLPFADWKFRDYEDSNWGWPQQWLRSMAQYPQQHDAWLGGSFALVANGEPPQPLASNTAFTTLLMLADQSLTNDTGDKIWLYCMTPLYTEERQLEIDEGIPALLNAFDAHDTPMIVDMNRKNVALE
ncbi:suppressor of fused domain protein [Rubripirellula reticaptiva]|uniref:Suppressor of fused protein (SUFU) n=1 Tax=Rubripirellula reticaptiva TaxID=2528013 RepID=A0A5C6F3V3_9BACT|nr:suppressor of fused domain protein [Rubripirellula reticaptiva]TWU56038.1 Suppressor of fused protein (SUFU) [Rubripirellula reticaptiva]